VSSARSAAAGDGVLRLQRDAGNAAVSRILALQRSVEQEGSPDHRPNLDVGDRGPGVALLQRMVGANSTGVFDAQTRAAVSRFQHQQGWAPSGVGPMTWAALDKVRIAAQPDPLQVVVPGTWVDDFKESHYEVDYRIEDKGGPSEWVQILYDDGTRVDLNWYDFEDVSLTTEQMTDALRKRYVGPGGRIVPGRATGGHLGLTRQLCPRLWAVRDEMEEMGARSTNKLMATSLAAVTFVMTVPSMAISPPAPDAPATKLKANRRTEPRGGGGPPVRPPIPGATPAAKVQAARDYYPGHGGEVGTLEAPGRDAMRVKSGVDGGPWDGTHRGGIPRGRGEAFTGGGSSQGNIATHVEGHSAAITHQQGLRNATLTMGRDQCSVCAQNLPTALPPGAKLRVIHVDEAGHLSETIYSSSQIPPRRN
jgi:SCP1.201-like deaminase/Putative peptidoglycan binding domain